MQGSDCSIPLLRQFGKQNPVWVTGDLGPQFCVTGVCEDRLLFLWRLLQSLTIADNGGMVDNSGITITDNSEITVIDNSGITITDNSGITITITDNSGITVTDNSGVTITDNSGITITDNSEITITITDNIGITITHLLTIVE